MDKGVRQKRCRSYGQGTTAVRIIKMQKENGMQINDIVIVSDIGEYCI